MEHCLFCNGNIYSKNGEKMLFLAYQKYHVSCMIANIKEIYDGDPKGLVYDLGIPGLDVDMEVYEEFTEASNMRYEESDIPHNAEEGDNVLITEKYGAVPNTGDVYNLQEVAIGKTQVWCMVKNLQTGELKRVKPWQVYTVREIQ